MTTRTDQGAEPLDGHQPLACGDAACNQDREAKMVMVDATIRPPYTKPVFCDPCIAPLVKALNDGGFRTLASCCGHNRRCGWIILDGDIWLTITDREHGILAHSALPGDINDEPQETYEELYERLTADFNDCNAERSRWKARAETAEAELSRLKEILKACDRRKVDDRRGTATEEQERAWCRAGMEKKRVGEIDRRSSNGGQK